MFLKRFTHTFRHKEIKCRNRLAAMLLILIGLEDNCSQSSITLYRLGRTDTAVLCTKTAFKQILQIILDTSRSLCRIIIQVMYMYVTQLVSFGKTFRQKVFISVILRYFRSESHHLPCRSMTGHISITKIDIVLVYRNNAIHDMFYLCFLITLGITPFTIDDIFFRNFRTYFHQFTLY